MRVGVTALVCLNTVLALLRFRTSKKQAARFGEVLKQVRYSAHTVAEHSRLVCEKLDAAP